ncbi:hypothetical protein, partial [Pseudomonas aeruginosa]|uniref:hypothetical protein n=1 Tax=Pseudomonas aeruginosa TaxID=287 RepID=UPI003CF82FB6
MVPEDRKRDGIVPVMAVGKNITLADSINLPVALASLMTRQSKNVFWNQSSNSKLKRRPPTLLL